MKNTRLISTDSELYAKRVVREVRQLMRSKVGVQVDLGKVGNSRVAQVRVSYGMPEVKIVGSDGLSGWINVLADRFFNETTGDKITASRTERNDDGN